MRRDWSTDALTNFIKLESASSHTGGAVAYKTLGPYGETGNVHRLSFSREFCSSAPAAGRRLLVRRSLARRRKVTGSEPLRAAQLASPFSLPFWERWTRQR